MSNHLTEDQISKCVIGAASAAELAHVHDCAECSVDIERFRESLSLFRTAVHDRAERQVVSAVPRRHSRPVWRWAVAVAAVVVLMVTVMPTYKNQSVPVPAEPPKATAQDDALLMEAISAHLSHVVPAPMEPVMALLPEGEADAVQGGVQ